jgi:hypothetical protein
MAKATVFANGLSIACKSVDGKSVAAFPDPCWTNPGPSIGPIVLPFANTAYARDTANASKTVFIGGKPIMLKDKSYFKTSTGNEAAAYGKGFFTGVKKGKAYFASWSMNVKIEGFNVCRHTDLMTHNHASKPSNTAFWYYNDQANKKPPIECAKDCEQIEKTCGKDISKCEAEEMCGTGYCRSEKAKKRIEERKIKKGNVRSLFMKKFGKKIEEASNWKQRNCRAVLLVNCGVFNKGGKKGERTDDATKQLNEQLEELTKLKDNIPKYLDEFIGGLGYEGLSRWWDGVWDGLIGKGVEKIATKKIPGYGQINMISDLANLRVNLRDFRKTVEATLPELIDKMKDKSRQLQESIDTLKSDIAYLEKIKNGEVDKDTFLKEQKKQAKKNQCVSARKCNLVPYKTGTKSLVSEEGCCPGQTPHHLVPNSMMQISEKAAGSSKDSARNSKDSNGQANCPDYEYAQAPCVCTEGISQHNCTHKEVHDVSAERFEGTFRRENQTPEKKISLDQAISDGAKAHEKAFGHSGCTKSKKNPKKSGCIEAQLREHYNRKCHGNLDFFVIPVDGKSPRKMSSKIRKTR